MSGKRTFHILLFVLTASALFTACKDDDSLFTGELQLNISTDTVYFDTVFTSAGPGIPISINQQFVVINPKKEKIKTDIFLAGDANSPFRINVDGLSGRSFSDIEIRGEDSIFVFVEISVPANQAPQSLPLIVRDSIIFNTNGRVQDVKLIAWGQDAHYLFRDSITSNTTWSDKEKPYVIYDYLYIKEDVKFTIEPGVRIHYSPRSWLWIEGTLEINGTKDEPVQMEGDRLQTTYDQRPGQWNGIRIHYPSKDNQITYLKAKNGFVGVFCDSIPANNNPNLIIRNSEIRNMQFDGISGRMSHIVAQNCILNNCGRFTFFGNWGGTYDLRHVTMYTGSGTFARRDPTCVLTNVQRNELGAIVRLFDLNATIANSIMMGNREDEFGFDLVDTAKYDLNIVHNLFNSTQLFQLQETPLNNILNKDPLFSNPTNYGFELQSGSPAINAGLNGIGVDKDYCGNNRDGQPDIGAYEFQ